MNTVQKEHPMALLKFLSAKLSHLNCIIRFERVEYRLAHCNPR